MNTIPCEAIAVAVPVIYLYLTRKDKSGDTMYHAAMMLAVGLLMCKEIKKRNATKESYGCKACA